MARYTGPKRKLSRREGIALFEKDIKVAELKGLTPPGQHVRGRRKKLSSFGEQLREKQKVKRIYGILERQFERYFRAAAKKKGETGKVLIQLLERRLDNTVYRLGFTPSRAAARQLINHGHIRIDDKKVDIPSYQVKEGQVVSLTRVGLKIPAVSKRLEETKKGPIPAWLEKRGAVGKVIGVPQEEDVGTGINQDLIIGYFSR